MSDLKPCPFCGAKSWDVFNDETVLLELRRYVRCSECKAEGPKSDREPESNWNRRAAPNLADYHNAEGRCPNV